jgi:O-acetyl-ADP-ribose deacetylase (regulator of RNase III)
MEATFGSAKLELIQGDITQQDTDAIVNAANKTLLGGGGVDGAIHRAAGPELLAECCTLGGCETGEAVITNGYNLKARYVIHTVGPVYGRGGPSVRNLLENAYRNSLSLAVKKGIRSISFPSISTGAYGYPLDEAAETALGTVIDFLRERNQLERVRFVLFGTKALRAFEEALQTWTAKTS